MNDTRTPSKTMVLPRPTLLLKDSSDQENHTEKTWIGCLLPTMKGCSNTPFPSVNVDTVASLLMGTMTVPDGRRVIIIDCRFPYEYNGGHIRGAINITGLDLKEQLTLLLTSGDDMFEPRRCILLFHCEFSKNRAPRTMEILRQMDRSMNEWPYVDFDEMYLIHGGYAAYHAAYPALCIPVGAYVSMNAQIHHCHHHMRTRSVLSSLPTTTITTNCALRRPRSISMRSFIPLLDEEIDIDIMTDDITDELLEGIDVTPRSSSHKKPDRNVKK